MPKQEKSSLKFNGNILANQTKLLGKISQKLKDECFSFFSNAFSILTVTSVDQSSQSYNFHFCKNGNHSLFLQFQKKDTIQKI